MAYNVPILSQRTISLCWEATAHMLWQWKQGKSAEALYLKKAGDYARMDAGLSEAQMDVFYRQLGIRSLASPAGKNVRYALKWSPVIITSVEQMQGHAMVVINHNLGQYEIINPCAVMAVNFDDAGDSGSCTSATTRLAQSQIDAKLGKFIWYW